eukprot:m.329985 g.329985  ORF g.329985 m.329985 type:complete len:72 (-) comp16043_c0_seq5:4468-4683(-)
MGWLSNIVCVAQILKQTQKQQTRLIGIDETGICSTLNVATHFYDLGYALRVAPNLFVLRLDTVITVCRAQC